MKNFLGLVALLCLAACGDSIVGGQCRAGYEVCRNSCVNTSRDNSNCGGCAISCVGFEQCVEGVCTDPSARQDAGTDPPDASEADASN